MHEIRERGRKVPPLRGGRNKAFSSPPKPTYLAHVAMAVPVSVVIEQVFSRPLQSQPCTIMHILASLFHSFALPALPFWYLFAIVGIVESCQCGHHTTQMVSEAKWFQLHL